MNQSWKQRHIHHLKMLYGPLAEAWRGITSDDRLVFCNIYRRMLEALNSLPDEPLNYVCVAMNHALQDDRKILDRIAAAFQGR